jgi:hypothetical protein
LILPGVSINKFTTVQPVKGWAPQRRRTNVIFDCGRRLLHNLPVRVTWELCGQSSRQVPTLICPPRNPNAQSTGLTVLGIRLCVVCLSEGRAWVLRYVDYFIQIGSCVCVLCRIFYKLITRFLSGRSTRYCGFEKKRCFINVRPVIAVLEAGTKLEIMPVRRYGGSRICG